MEPVTGCLGLPLPSLGLGFGFFGATLAAGLAARAFELEEETSCDAYVNCEQSPDRSGATHRQILHFFLHYFAHLPMSKVQRVRVRKCKYATFSAKFEYTRAKRGYNMGGYTP